MSTSNSTTVEYFGYEPIDGLAWAAMSVFIVLAATLLWTNSRYPPCKFMYVLVAAACFEAAGYGLRVEAAHDTTLLTFIFPTLFILLVPNAIALVNYIAVGRALQLSWLNVACLRPTWIARTFFISDVLSFSVQGFGGALLSSTNSSTIDLGEKVILIGLLIQCATLFLFLFTTIALHAKPQYLLRDKQDGINFITGLYITTSLLFIRSIYRAIPSGSHEWLLYVFDCIPVAACFAVYTIPALHYGRCLNALAVQFSLLPHQTDVEAGLPVTQMVANRLAMYPKPYNAAAYAVPVGQK